jgi:hypothetical protein
MNPAIAAKLKYWILILLGLAVAAYMYQSLPARTPTPKPPTRLTRSTRLLTPASKKEEWVIDCIIETKDSKTTNSQGFLGEVTNANISENEISGVWHYLLGPVPFSLKKSRDGKNYEGWVNNGTAHWTLSKYNDYRYEGHWCDNENGSGEIYLISHKYYLEGK